MKRTVFTILLFSLVLSSGCAYYNTFYNAKKFYREAEKEREKREKTQVVELSAEEEAQLKKSGRSAQDKKNRASQQEMQNYQLAIERASRVLEFYPDSKWVDDALMLLGKCFYYRRDFKKGLRKFDELLQLYPNSEFIPEARLLKAKTYIGLEEYDTAEQMLKKIAADTKVPKRIREEAKFELGGLYYTKENYELAAENYRSSARSARAKLIKAMSQYRLGECLLRLQNYDEAPAVLRRAVKEAPNEDFLSQAMFKLGEAYSLQEDYDRAIKTFRNALSKEYDTKRIPRIKLELAENLRKSGQLSEAIKWYENIIQEHKRTDASARSYYALGQIAEFVAEDYVEAKKNYELVRSEFSSSLIAPIAKERADNIQTLLDLSRDIAKLEGRAFAADSLENAENGDVAEGPDDGPINLSADGMWVNYTGRDRPPPMTLRDLSEADRARQAMLQEKLAEQIAKGDSAALAAAAMTAAPLDSAALAKQAEEEARKKEIELSSKYLSLAEIMLFAFDKPDSAIKYYQAVVEKNADSIHVARALYSLAYVYNEFFADSVLSKTVLKELVDIFPETDHAEGARQKLGFKLKSERVDPAESLFQQAEDAYFRDNNLKKSFALWDEIAKKYPDSPYAQKAVFAKAWHFEHTLFQLDSAIAVYEKIIEQYPDTPFSEKAKPKLAAVEQARKREEARQKAIADSLAKLAAADSLAADSLAAGQPADTTTSAAPVPSNKTLQGKGTPPPNNPAATRRPMPGQGNAETARRKEPGLQDNAAGKPPSSPPGASDGNKKKARNIKNEPDVIR